MQSFFLNCKLSYLLQEFPSFILVGVYIPPHARVNDAQASSEDQLIRVELKHTDSLFIILLKSTEQN